MRRKHRFAWGILGPEPREIMAKFSLPIRGSWEWGMSTPIPGFWGIDKVRLRQTNLV